MSDFSIKIIKNIKWNYLIDISARLMQPIILCVLARILIPEDFGLYGMALVIISFVVVLQNIGIGYGLINLVKDDNEYINVAFFVNILFGLFCFLLVFFFAPFYSIYINNLSVVEIIRTLSIIFIVNSLFFTQRNLLMKRLQFYKLFILNVVSIILSGITSIGLALVGLGVWALVIGFLIGPVSSSFLIWFLVEWRPKLKFNRKIANYFLTFGGFVIVESLLSWLVGNSDYIFVGKFLGSNILGIYYLAYYFALLPLHLITTPIISVLYPAFCRLKNKPELLKDYYLHYLANITLVCFVFGIMIFFCSPYFIPLFLGSKWLKAVVVIRILTLSGILAPLVIVNFELFRAMGRIVTSLKFLTIRVIFSVPLYYLAAKRGVVEVSFVHLLLAFLFVPINLYLCHKLVKWRFSEFLSIVKVPFYALVVSGVCGFCFEKFILILFINNVLLQLILISLVLMGSYIVTIFILDKKRLINIKQMFFVAF